MVIKVCTNQGAGPFWAQKEATIWEILGIWKIFLLENEWPECIDIWYEATLGQGV